MRKLFLLFFVALLTAGFTHAQQPVTTATKKDSRYQKVTFTDIQIDKDISYSDNSVGGNGKYHLFDLYQPAGDNIEKRPLIIWMHGGGFKFGSKNATEVELWCKYYAQRGYVCAAINYTLSKKDPLFNFHELKRSTYHAVQDARMAVRFFKNNASTYHIDPDKIILGGNSAGGIIAMQAVYASNAELSVYAGVTDKKDDVGTATTITSTTNDRTKVFAVINFWGAMFNLSWLENAHTSIIGVAGSEDHIINPNTKNGELYGVIAIHRRADSLKITNKLKIFDGYSHELEKHFNPLFAAGGDTEARWLQAAQFVVDNLYLRVNQKPLAKKPEEPLFLDKYKQEY